MTAVLSSRDIIKKYPTLNEQIIDHGYPRKIMVVLGERRSDLFVELWQGNPKQLDNDDGGRTLELFFTCSASVYDYLVKCKWRIQNDMLQQVRMALLDGRVNRVLEMVRDNIVSKVELRAVFTTISLREIVKTFAKLVLGNPETSEDTYVSNYDNFRDLLKLKMKINDVDDSEYLDVVQLATYHYFVEFVYLFADIRPSEFETVTILYHLMYNPAHTSRYRHIYNDRRFDTLCQLLNQPAQCVDYASDIHMMSYTEIYKKYRYLIDTAMAEIKK